jgi:predicted dehydrogenase
MPLRVGFVTAAHLHVWSYVASLKAHPQAEAVGVWDHDDARGAAFAEKSGLPQFGSLDELLAAVDAVVIVSENVKHAEHAVAAASAGKHVLCEKPVPRAKRTGSG